MARNPATSDLQDHLETYGEFLTLLKTAIITLIFAIVALFNLIVAGHPWFGLFLLVIALPVALAINRPTSARS